MGGTLIQFVDIHILSLISENVTVLSLWQALPMWFYLILLLIITIKIFLNYKWSYWHKRGIDGPTPTIFGLGNLSEIFQFFGGSNQIGDWIEKHGTVIGLYMFWTPSVIIMDVNIIRQINIKQFSNFPLRQAKSGFDTIFGPLSSDFMTIIAGAQWRRVRHTTIPLMSQAKLTHLIPLIKMAADVVSKRDIKEDEEFEAKILSSSYTIKAMMSSGFSIDPYDKKAMDEAQKHARNVIPDGYGLKKMAFLALVPEKIRFYFNLSVCLPGTMHYFTSLFDYLLKQHQEHKNNGRKRFKDLSSQMMESLIDDEDKFNANILKGYTKSELMANSLLFIIAGHDTTASVLQFLLFELANHPELQDQLLTEIKSFNKLSYENIRDFKLLDAAIKESMRLYPAAPQNSRFCTETTEVSETLTIEKGTAVFWDNMYFHHSAEFYQNPKKFDPSRWNGNESTTLQDEHWFGFGQGPRSCPGVRLAYITMKMFIITILTDHQIIPCEKTPKEVTISVTGLKLMSNPPIIIKFKKRME